MNSSVFTWIPPVPSRETVCAGEALNVLGGVINPGKAVWAKITLWGRCGALWKPLVTQEVFLKEKEHRHLYFMLPPKVFSSAYWDGQCPEELELLICDRKPSDSAFGKLIFMERR